MLASILESYHAQIWQTCGAASPWTRRLRIVYHLNRGLLRSRMIQLSQLLREREI